LRYRCCVRKDAEEAQLTLDASGGFFEDKQTQNVSILGTTFQVFEEVEALE